MLIGHRLVQQEFGKTPRIAWLLDSFGHSAGNARLYSDMGLEAMFIGRLDVNDKIARVENRNMNYLWRPHSENFGDQNQILVSFFRDHYCWPEGFYVDERYDVDEVFEPDQTMSTFNAH